MIKKEMSHILGRDIAHETLSNTKKINAEISEIKEKLDEISRALGSEEKNREDRERLFYIQKNTEVSQEFLSNEYVSLYCRERSKKPRVLVCGFYGAKNVGDELMLEAILKLLPAENLDVTILLSNNYDIDASEYAPFRVLHYPKRSSDMAAIAENFDVVVWGGGAMLDDVDYAYRGQYSTMAYILMSITKAVLKKDGQAFVYGISANDKLSDKTFIEDLNYIIHHSDYFSLRDTNSLKVLKEAGVQVDKIRIIDDVSIYNLYNKELKIKKSDDEITCIGLNLILYEDRLAEYKQIVKHLAEYYNKPIKIVLIPFYNYGDSDNKVLNGLINETQNKLVKFELAKQPNDIDELLSIYEKCDFIFAMRYHAVLMAALMHKHAIMIDFQKNHRHYLNKNSYIKTKYVPSLLILEYNDLYKYGIPKDTKISETGITPAKLDEIAKSIVKEIHSSLKRIRRQ